MFNADAIDPEGVAAFVPEVVMDWLAQEQPSGIDYTTYR